MVVVGVLVLAMGIGAVLAYPAWSASRGEDVRWTLPNRADALLDHDADRLLLVRDETLLVVDRGSGAPLHRPGRVDADRRAALVPGGVVLSGERGLAMTPDRGRDGWEKADGAIYVLQAVDVDAGLAVASVVPKRGEPGAPALTAFALADGAPVWTLPGLARADPIMIGPGSTRPPGWLRGVRLVPVVPAGGYLEPPAADPARWQLIDVTSGTATGETMATDEVGPPVTVGGMTTAAWGQPCDDLTILGGPEVRWPDGPLDGECFLVWAIDTDRLLFTAWKGGPDNTDGGITMMSLALDSGKITPLDWTGTYPDSDTQDVGRELTRSWGRYLVSRGVVYDTTTGGEQWRASDVWLSGDTAVVAEPVTGLDRLAAGASADSRWVRLADAATGDPTGGEMITEHRVRGAYVFDRGEAVIFTAEETVYLASK
jgi:hypothetical protein